MNKEILPDDIPVTIPDETTAFRVENGRLYNGEWECFPPQLERNEFGNFQIVRMQKRDTYDSFEWGISYRDIAPYKSCRINGQSAKKIINKEELRRRVLILRHAVQGTEFEWWTEGYDRLLAYLEKETVEEELIGNPVECAGKALEFGRKYNKSAQPCEQIKKLYDMAGVPFTEAAADFFDKYGGIFVDTNVLQNVRGEMRHIDFEVLLFGTYPDRFDSDVDELREYYTECTEAGYPDEPEWPDIPTFVKSHPEWEAVPVGQSGYYYPAVIWVAKGGRILAFHDYNDDELQEYADFAEFMAYELKNNPPAVVRKRETL